MICTVLSRKSKRSYSVKPSDNSGSFTAYCEGGETYSKGQTVLVTDRSIIGKVLPEKPQEVFKV